jgi:hypothetical protein
MAWVHGRVAIVPRKPHNVMEQQPNRLFAPILERDTQLPALETKYGAGGVRGREGFLQ